jgi:hypothetical protein
MQQPAADTGDTSGLGVTVLREFLACKPSACRAAILARNSPFGGLPMQKSNVPRKTLACACGAGDSPAKAEPLLGPLQNRVDSGGLRLLKAQTAHSRVAERMQQPVVDTGDTGGLGVTVLRECQKPCWN